ncbi:aminotransferase class V-fold PLP-dependent enzyme [Sedimenticola selenatireducens]|uniref:Aminotransferase class V-fold PLP-dependent enzyme n=1 Tax=Sedimenticola selenatireducens TaxID=191960 RepID=A0A557RZA1_9GAMM|nr:aminotransferase class V-fold PLP-dependent enzyme [Sedimenticola selenatireducens]TVO70474.1 aminotransferase class V-fold PLP-dependent enzyme [Sedimenticola selenatireducens]TVT63051.1 MAG: aminotransferase class V-fold PLP-dependent enzyme [Sedimenticola selenatireducens]
MYSKEFSLNDNLIYLNHAAVAPWPARTALAVSQFAQENASQGATHYLKWLKIEEALRTHLSWLINAPSVDDIALQKSTSEALSTIAFGLDWSAGDNVVIYQQEFPSNRLVWQMLEPYGVECRLFDLDSAENPEEALLKQCDEHTRLISVSSVQYASGLRTDLLRIGEFCRQNRILLCVDAIQSLGAFEFDVQSIGADFVVADGHKWMLGPEGIALLYVNPELRNNMKLHQFGWHMVEPVGDYDSMETTPAKTARRFECGSPNMLGIHALYSSLSLIKEVGLEQISSAILHNSMYLNELILSHPQLKLISSTDKERVSGIVTFQVKGGDHQRIYKELMSRGVICAPRGGGIRFSPHFYISRDELARAMQIVDEIII